MFGQVQQQTQNSYLLGSNINIANKNSINFTLIVALIAFISDIFIVPLLGFTISVCIWDASNNPPCTYSLNDISEDEICNCPGWSVYNPGDTTTNSNDYGSCSWTSDYDDYYGDFQPSKNYCQLEYWPFGVILNFVRGCAITLLIVATLLVLFCFLMFNTAAFIICFIIILVLYSLFWLFAKILKHNIANPWITSKNAFEQAYTLSIDALYTYFSKVFDILSRFVIAVVGKIWGYIALHLYNFISAVVMIVFVILLPVINVSCNKYGSDSTTNTGNMNWDPMWYTAFNRNMIFILIIFYCLFIFFGIFARRIVDSTLSQFQPTGTYRLFIYEYHGIIFQHYGQGGQANAYQNAGYGKTGKSKKWKGKGKKHWKQYQY